MSDLNQARGTVRVYACGGCGVNIGSMLEAYRSEVDLSVAAIDVAYIDTSRSNISSDIPNTHVYVMEGLDGSGKLRRENHKAIAGCVRDVLLKFPPLDVSIVISSASGGSGSVIAPTLVGELLTNQHPVIVFTVGSADTKIEADNTLKTLKSYETVSKMKKIPIVMSYIQNTKSRTRADVDDITRDKILSIAILYSKNNRELDSQDLFNFLRFDRVTNYKEPRIAALSVAMSDEVLTDVGDVITVATLANAGDATSLEHPPEYQCVGFLPALAPKEVRENVPLHFYTTDGLFDIVSAELMATLKSIDQAHNARIKKGSLLTDDDEATDHGIVL